MSVGTRTKRSDQEGSTSEMMNQNQPRWVSFDRLTPSSGEVLARSDAEDRLLEAARQSQGHIEPMAAALESSDLVVPVAGAGETLRQWELLATVASVDLVAARVLEPHMDAVTILHQAGMPAPNGLLGVYASESGGQTPTAQQHGRGWRLEGLKPWCSLGSVCSAAVVTARPQQGVEDERPRAFLVELDQQRRQGRVKPTGQRWSALGLTAVTTTPLEFSAAPARPVGGPGWYLQRPGFAWGGIAVAACWFGGAVQVVRTLQRQQRPDDFSLAGLGRLDRLLSAAAAQFLTAAQAIDAGGLRGEAAAVIADRVRGTVAELCTEVMQVVGELTGPGPLAADPAHARAVADLQLYVRQHHAARDDARLGRGLLAAPEWAW